jgi:hypothetical protein
MEMMGIEVGQRSSLKLGVAGYIIAWLSHLIGYFHNIGSQLLRHLRIKPIKTLQHLFTLSFEALVNLKQHGILVVQVLHLFYLFGVSLTQSPLRRQEVVSKILVKHFFQISLKMSEP